MNEKIIEVKDLSFRYGVHTILVNVNFDLERGDFTGIIGPNGSGKSTLLKLLLGILRPSSGTIKLFGVPAEAFRDWPKIGYVSQKNQLQIEAPVSVYEAVSANLYEKGGFLHILSKDNKNKVKEALNSVGLYDKLKSPVGNLSGGEQQRVSLARVLINDPQILLMDEPASGMDTESEKAMYDLLHKLNTEKKVSVVMVTHDLTAITAHAGRLFCMGNCRMIEHDMSEELDASFMAELYGRSIHMHVHDETHEKSAEDK